MENQKVHPLYEGNVWEIFKRGGNNLYLDVNVVNSLRKRDETIFKKLKDILIQQPGRFKLYYSAAHLGDYLRDDTDHKNSDLSFME